MRVDPGAPGALGGVGRRAADGRLRLGGQRPEPALFRFDLATGKLTGTLPGPEDGQPTRWATSPSRGTGDVYATDSRAAGRLPGAGGRRLARAIRRVAPAAVGPGAGAGRARSAPYTWPTTPGACSGSISRTREVGLLAGARTTCSRSASTASISWAAPVGIQNGVTPHRVVRLRARRRPAPHRRASSVLERARPDYAEPTLGVVVDGDLYYVANSQWETLPRRRPHRGARRRCDRRWCCGCGFDSPGGGIRLPPRHAPRRLLHSRTPSRVDLRGASKDEILAELVGLLRLDARASDTLLRMLQRRETLGSTGVGRGIAIPHCRSLVVTRLRLAYGHHAAGRGVPGDRQPPGPRFLPHRRPAARDLQPVPPGPREDRAVRQGGRHSGSAVGAPIGGRVPPPAGREGSVGGALGGARRSPAAPPRRPPLAGQSPPDRSSPRPLPRFTRHRPRHRPAHAAAPLAHTRDPPRKPTTALRAAYAALRLTALGVDPDAGDARSALRPLARHEPALAVCLARAGRGRDAPSGVGARRIHSSWGTGWAPARSSARSRMSSGRSRPTRRTHPPRSPSRTWHSDCATRPSSPPPGTRFVVPTRRSPQPPRIFCSRAAGSSGPRATGTARRPSFARAAAAGGQSGALARLELARTRFATGAADGDSAYYEAVRGDDPAVVAGYRADLGADRGGFGPRPLRRRGRRRRGRRGSDASGPTATMSSFDAEASASASTIDACSTPAGTSRSRSPAGSTERRDAYRSRQRGAGRSRRDLRPPRGAGDPPPAVRLRPDAQRDLAVRPGRRRPPVPLQRRLRRLPAAATCTTTGWSRACSIFAARPRRRPTNCCSRARRSRRSTAGCSTGVPTAAPSRAAASAAIGRASIDFGTTTDSYELQYAHRLTAYADLVAVGARDGLPLAHFVFAIAPPETTPTTTDGVVAYPVRVRLVALDGVEHAVARVDTSFDIRLARPLARGEYLIGRAELALPPGLWGWRAAVEQRGDAGIVLPRDTVRVAPVGPSFALSDLALGIGSASARWLPTPGDTVLLTPFSLFLERSQVELYYEASGMASGTEYEHRIAVYRVKGGRTPGGAAGRHPRFPGAGGWRAGQGPSNPAARTAQAGALHGRGPGRRAWRARGGAAAGHPGRESEVRRAGERCSATPSLSRCSPARPWCWPRAAPDAPRAPCPSVSGARPAGARRPATPGRCR